jgi:hypothetical protein
VPRLRERYLELLHRAADRPEATLAYIASAEGSASAAYLQLSRLSIPNSVVGAQNVPALRCRKNAAVPGPARAGASWPRCGRNVIRIEVSDIRANDNFFELGGDSLLAQRAVQQTEKLLGYRVAPQRYLFETLGQIAASSADGGSGAHHAAGRRRAGTARPAEHAGGTAPRAAPACWGARWRLVAQGGEGPSD